MGYPAKPVGSAAPAAPQQATLLEKAVPTAVSLHWQKYAEEQRWESHLCGPTHERANAFLCCLAKPVPTSEQLLKLQPLNKPLKFSLGIAPSSQSLPSSFKQMVDVVPSLHNFSEAVVLLRLS